MELSEMLTSHGDGNNNKIRQLTNCNMTGGGFSGLTSHTFRPLSCGSDTPDCIGTARPHTSDR